MFHNILFSLKDAEISILKFRTVKLQSTDTDFLSASFFIIILQDIGSICF